MGRGGRTVLVVLIVALLGLLAGGALFLWIIATGMEDAFTDPDERGARVIRAAPGPGAT